MLTASSDRVFAGSRVRSTIVLERRFRIMVLHRDRLLFDSRFSPPVRRGAEGATLYVVVAGSFQIAGGAVVSGPQAYLLGENEFENVRPGSSTFRSWGTPNVTLEVRLAADVVRAQVGLSAGPVVLGASTWSRCRALAGACAGGDPIEELVRALIRDLGDDRVVDSGVEASIPGAEPEAFVRLWSGLRPLYASHATSASLRDVKRATGLSLRQLGRDLDDFTRTFGLGGGFRDATRVLRLRTAILLLSAPGANATEVAREVGYKSLDAMGRAFREARLLAPSLVQDEVRYHG